MSRPMRARGLKPNEAGPLEADGWSRPMPARGVKHFAFGEYIIMSRAPYECVD